MLSSSAEETTTALPPAAAAPPAAPSIVMVAVDGSRLSHQAFDVAMSLKCKNEKVIIYHVYDSSKTMKQQRELLSSYFGHEHLEIEFISKCLAVKCTNYSIVCEDRFLSSTNSTSKMIMNYADNNNVTTLVVGSFGRKGPSVWGVGSKVKQTIHSARSGLTVVTAKINSRTYEKVQTFVVGIDGSPKSFESFIWSMNRIQHKNDRINVIHIRNEERESLMNFDPLVEIGEKIEELVKNNKNGKEFQWDVMYESRDTLVRLSAQIIQCASDLDSTYLVVGKDGVQAAERALKMQVGTVTNQIAEKGRMTTVVVG
jgi:nucleotide-binding universal stress UspA family protein